jgi:hypothetical protein
LTRMQLHACCMLLHTSIEAIKALFLFYCRL